MVRASWLTSQCPLPRLKPRSLPMKMKTALSLVAAAVALLSHSAFAQDKSRAEVKEETKKAVKAGETKAGEGQPDPRRAQGRCRQGRQGWRNQGRRRLAGFGQGQVDQGSCRTQGRGRCR